MEIKKRIKSIFCHHKWNMLYQNDVRFHEWRDMPLYHQWIFQCEKCGKIKCVSMKK